MVDYRVFLDLYARLIEPIYIDWAGSPPGGRYGQRTLKLLIPFDSEESPYGEMKLRPSEGKSVVPRRLIRHLRARCKRKRRQYRRN